MWRPSLLERRLLVNTLVSRILRSLHADSIAVFWFWFPLGPAGIRTLLLFISALSIFVLRVAQLHIGMMRTQCRANLIAHYSDRKSNNSFTIQYLHQISFPTKHRSDLGLVLLLSMVVQRGIHVVSAQLGKPGLGV